ncbi:hypothetical protein PR202_ga03543 [Eleusine coracana subsp. coracana]|uniref:PGG domain-containing protein n=1 Tax=Eleusine coracana subsp. coracana TaxID=191504 RepID=A0AAV5BMW5_ELECO|nr:hypothetical protein PR202_ga03543 [Eleusine coracana subsp. coracana]
MRKARDLVMLLATLVVSITYQAGLDPAGGLFGQTTVMATRVVTLYSQQQTLLGTRFSSTATQRPL